MNSEATSDIKAYSSRTADKFVVRLPKGMRDRISSVAKNYHRSMNSEIVSRLESSLSHEFTNTDHDANTESGQRHEMNVSAKEKELILRLRTLPLEKTDALLELLGQ